MTESDTDLDQIIARVLAMLPDPARPVLLAGPTASGKSAIALALAQAQGRAIVNADALQVWDMWRVLTARPDADDERKAAHFLYGTVSRDQTWSVGHWLRAVVDVLSHNPNAVIVGGTGLYFRALTEGLVEIPPTPADLRHEADARLAREGMETLLAELDPLTAARIDRANPARIQRAWEVLQATGRGLAEWHANTPPAVLPVSETTAFVLRPSVAWGDKRIATRFEHMLHTGALDEARAAVPFWDDGAPWAKAIGAPELIAHLQGHISLSKAQADATLATRQYAKRQRTWFRARMGTWTTLH